jgi:hypothetical protein
MPNACTGHSIDAVAKTNITTGLCSCSFCTHCSWFFSGGHQR